MIFVLAPKIYLFLRGFSSRMGECRGEFFAKKVIAIAFIIQENIYLRKNTILT